VPVKPAHPVEGRVSREAIVDREECRAQLDRILSSRTFQRPKQLRQLLVYITTHYIEGRRESLKEYTLGLEVFRRKASFNPASDPIVRVEASRLRRQLATYYQREGINDPIWIHLPRGTYVPSISARPLGARDALNVQYQNENAVLILPFVLFQEHKISCGAATTILTDPLMHGLTRRSSLRILPRLLGVFDDPAPTQAHITIPQDIRFIVEGSIMNANGKSRIFVHLADMRTRRNRWSARYDADDISLLDTLDEILTDLLDELRLAADEPTQPVTNEYP